jgi:hypothetical protein
MSSHSNRRLTNACRVRPIAFLKLLRTLSATFCPFFLSTLPLLAWVFPERREIAVLALQRLDPDSRAVLDKLWSDARTGHETRLCSQIADPAQGEKPPCIDYAAWASIAGDHSCSARDMLGEVLDSPWIPNVAAVAARLKAKLAAAERRDQRENAVRDSDLALLRADPEYVTRAASNDAHFLLARTDVTMTPEAYAHLALGANAPLNALASYMWYHLRALAQAAHLATGAVAQDSRAQDARTILADEAFALHFLEDSFAAGQLRSKLRPGLLRQTPFAGSGMPHQEIDEFITSTNEDVNPPLPLGNPRGFGSVSQKCHGSCLKTDGNESERSRTRHA